EVRWRLTGGAVSARPATPARPAPPHRPKRSYPGAHQGWVPLRTNDNICSFAQQWRRWGTRSTVERIDGAAELFATSGNGRISVGDASTMRGGFFPPHLSHRDGMDVDIRPIGRYRRQCSHGLSWQSPTYDRQGTERLIKDIRRAA